MTTTTTTMDDNDDDEDRRLLNRRFFQVICFVSLSSFHSVLLTFTKPPIYPSTQTIYPPIQPNPLLMAAHIL